VIFAAVGTQLPFDRLFDTLEPIARRHQLRVIAQTGDPARHSDVMECHDRLAPARFNAIIGECDIVVGHAGIGVIIAAATHNKPLILMPRRASLGEHRNDHQLATTSHFASRPGIVVVHDAAEMEAALLRVSPEPLRFEGGEQRQRLINAISQAIAR
jgi:UDP-N-acetylglucosamine transferase subunit ALG13